MSFHSVQAICSQFPVHSFFPDRPVADHSQAKKTIFQYQVSHGSSTGMGVGQTCFRCGKTDHPWYHYPCKTNEHALNEPSLRLPSSSTPCLLARATNSASMNLILTTYPTRVMQKSQSKSLNVTRSCPLITWCPSLSLPPLAPLRSPRHTMQAVTALSLGMDPSFSCLMLPSSALCTRRPSQSWSTLHCSTYSHWDKEMNPNLPLKWSPFWTPQYH